MRAWFGMMSPEESRYMFAIEVLGTTSSPSCHSSTNPSRGLGDHFTCITKSCHTRRVRGASKRRLRSPGWALLPPMENASTSSSAESSAGGGFPPSCFHWATTCHEASGNDLSNRTEKPYHSSAPAWIRGPRPGLACPSSARSLLENSGTGLSPPRTSNRYAKRPCLTGHVTVRIRSPATATELAHCERSPVSASPAQKTFPDPRGPNLPSDRIDAAPHASVQKAANTSASATTIDLRRGRRGESRAEAGRARSRTVTIRVWRTARRGRGG